MLPSIISHEVQEGIERFLESTFPCLTPLFEGCLTSHCWSHMHKPLSSELLSFIEPMVSPVGRRFCHRKHTVSSKQAFILTQYVPQ
jgi:hypothetical protein